MDGEQNQKRVDRGKLISARLANGELPNLVFPIQTLSVAPALLTLDDEEKRQQTVRVAVSLGLYDTFECLNAFDGLTDLPDLVSQFDFDLTAGEVETNAELARGFLRDKTKSNIPASLPASVCREALSWPVVRDWTPEKFFLLSAIQSKLGIRGKDLRLGKTMSQEELWRRAHGFAREDEFELLKNPVNLSRVSERQIGNYIRELEDEGFFVRYRDGRRTWYARPYDWKGTKITKIDLALYVERRKTSRVKDRAHVRDESEQIRQDEQSKRAQFKKRRKEVLPIQDQMQSLAKRPVEESSLDRVRKLLGVNLYTLEQMQQYGTAGKERGRVIVDRQTYFVMNEISKEKIATANAMGVVVEMYRSNS